MRSKTPVGQQHHHYKGDFGPWWTLLLIFPSSGIVVFIYVSVYEQELSDCFYSGRYSRSHNSTVIKIVLISPQFEETSDGFLPDYGPLTSLFLEHLFISAPLKCREICHIHNPGMSFSKIWE